MTWLEMDDLFIDGSRAAHRAVYSIPWIIREMCYRMQTFARSHGIYSPYLGWWTYVVMSALPTQDDTYLSDRGFWWRRTTRGRYDWELWNNDHFLEFEISYAPISYDWEQWIVDMFDPETSLST